MSFLGDRAILATWWCRLRCAVAVLVALVFAALTVTAPSPWGAPPHTASAQEAPAPGAEGAEGTTGPGGAASLVDLRLAGQSPWVGPDGRFDLAVRVEGAPQGAALRVVAHQAVGGRIRFEESIGGGRLGAPLLPVPPPIELGLLARDRGAYLASYAVTTGTPPPFGFQITRPGVYPVEVAVVDALGTVLDSFVTHIVRLPPPGRAGSPLAVATVVGFGAPVATLPGGGFDLPDPTRSELDALSRVLRDRPGVPLTLDANPETLAALAGGGPADEESLAALGTALHGRELLGRPYVPLDLASWFDVGRELDVVAEFQAGAATVESVLRRVPEPGTWLADATTDPASLTRLRFLGMTRVVVPESLLEPLTGAAAEDPLTQRFAVLDDAGAPVPAVAADAALTSRLTATDDPVLNAHLTLADLAILQGYAPGSDRGVVLHLPAQPVPSAATLSTLLAGLDPASAEAAGGDYVVEAMTVAELTAHIDPLPPRGGGPAGSVRVRAVLSEPPRPLGDLPERIDVTSSNVAGFRSMLPDDDTPAIPYERSLLAARAATLSPAEADAHVDAVDAALAAHLAAVVLPERQQVTLTAEDTRIPLALESALPWEVEVRLVLRSPKLTFPEGSSPVVRLAPGSTTRVEIAVEANATGAFPLEMYVRSPDGVLLIGETRLGIRSTAVPGLGLVLSIGAGVFLAGWWGLHFRKVRRNRLLISVDHPSRRGAANGNGTHLGEPAERPGGDSGGDRGTERGGEPGPASPRPP